MSNMTMLRPYQRFPDRKLLKLFVASKERALETGDSLTSEGFLQADELLCRNYNVADLDDLRRRLEK
jgi:hypothetical protein